MAYGTHGEWQVRDDLGRRKYLSHEERLAFIAEADQLPPSMRAFCHVLAYTGCRISEALALSTHQLDTREFTLTIKTLKRRRTHFRGVPIPEPLAVVLTTLPTGEDGRFWTIDRSTGWRCHDG